MASILIVDDSEFIKGTLRSILQQAGHTIVAEASDGEQAFKQYVGHRPDLVTMDITMSDSDGIESIKNITKSFPDAKIIVVSALSNKETVFEALQCGAIHYVFKPFSATEIIEAVNYVLNKQ